MRVVALIASFVLLGSQAGQAQQGTVSAQDSQASALNSIQRAIEKSLLLEPRKASVTFAKTRPEQIRVLHGLVERFETEFTLTPIPTQARGVPYQNLTQEENRLLYRLISGGFLPGHHTLAIGPGDASDAEFGAALGWVAIRILELCHEPDKKYSPYLADPNE